MSAVLRIRRVLAAMVAILALVAFLAFGALAQTGGEESCDAADDYGECVEAWVEHCTEHDDPDFCNLVNA